MPKVTIDGRTLEVEKGTNLIDAGLRVGVHVPHYCYHPRLSVVGQCRMCLVELEGVPKLQAACVTRVEKDGMVVNTRSEKVQTAQNGMMEFFLVNHPLDCPICDQAGECGLQDYSFKHGQAFSRYQYEDKRTYPGRERIPLGPNILLNMNRCIQCTRCIRFTHEISGTGELAFVNRGGRVEIGTFPGKELDNELATNVVDICPVGALTSTRFRFAERVWYLDKEPSVCTGCDAGCNITVEHRRGKIRRYKPRYNPEVNDYWMCDYGRQSWERYQQLPRLTAPRVRRHAAHAPDTAAPAEMGNAATWNEALDRVADAVKAGGEVAILGSGHLTTEEAYLLAQLADHLPGDGGAHKMVVSYLGPERHIPNLEGGVTGRETTPNRRGVEMAGLVSDGTGGLEMDDLLNGDGAAGLDLLIVADSDFGPEAHDEETVARLRRAKNLVVLGWADSALARAADVALPIATHTETEGTFVNVQGRLQTFDRCYPAPGQCRPGVEVLADLLGRFDKSWIGADAPRVFGALSGKAAPLASLESTGLGAVPAGGVPLELPPDIAAPRTVSHPAAS
jgi:NADH-quinone oxidoreductase subunit G